MYRAPDRRTNTKKQSKYWIDDGSVPSFRKPSDPSGVLYVVLGGALIVVATVLLVVWFHARTNRVAKNERIAAPVLLNLPIQLTPVWCIALSY